MSSYMSFDGRSCRGFVLGEKVITVATFENENVLSFYIQEKGKKMKVIKTCNLNHSFINKLLGQSSLLSNKE